MKGTGRIVTVGKRLFRSASTLYQYSSVRTDEEDDARTVQEPFQMRSAPFNGPNHRIIRVHVIKEFQVFSETMEGEGLRYYYLFKKRWQAQMYSIFPSGYCHL
jgi:hypothetical protein